MKQVLVIGAGPAGMMAACKAAESGANVTLFERKEAEITSRFDALEKIWDEYDVYTKH